MTAAQILDLESLQKENAALRSENIEQHNKIIYLEEQLAWLKRQIFGERSERVVSNLNEQQLELEGFEQQRSSEQTQKVSTHQRRKPNRQGQDKITLPPDLPVETVVLDLPEIAKICQETGEMLVKIGEETTHKLVEKPGSFYIKEIIRPKYVNPRYKAWFKAMEGVISELQFPP